MLLRDAVGTLHQPAVGVPRIVSLVPSLTELLFDLGLGELVVGRTAWCVHPREARAVTRVGGTKDVDLDRIRALAPTHAIVNVDENPRQTYDALREFVPHVLVTHPLAPRDNLDLYRLLGGVFGREAEAGAIAERFESAWARLREAGPYPPLRVLLLIWREPWMTVSRDTYVSRMLATVNWRTAPGESEARYPVVEPDEPWLDEVERVLCATEPFPFRERHLAEAGRLAPGRPVEIIDGEMISWYGSRAIRGLEYLAGLAATTAGLTAGSATGRI